VDREKLAADWETEPTLRGLAFDSVDELGEHLLKLHKFLMSPTAGPLGYLYQQQTRRAREGQQR
jgi:hypothetical protein